MKKPRMTLTGISSIALSIGLSLSVLIAKCQTVSLVGSNQYGVYSLRNDGTDPKLLVDLRPFEGSGPSSVVIVNNKLFCSVGGGGEYGFGALFSMNFDGSEFVILHSFNQLEGRTPVGELSILEEHLWGTTFGGGENGDGVIYKMGLDGSNFEVVHSFNRATEGFRPSGGLVEINDKIYGVTSNGGTGTSGTVYSLEKDGSGFTTIISNLAPGSSPNASLIEVNGKIWGVTRFGGNGEGVIFRMNFNGGDFEIVHEFQGDDGGEPTSSLMVSEDKVWGTTLQGGSSNQGVIFSLNTDGTNYTVAHEFGGTDGSGPSERLVALDGKLWGTAIRGGENQEGTLFCYDLSNQIFEKLIDFDRFTGSSPGQIIYANNELYLQMGGGGKYGFGTTLSFNLETSEISKIYEFAQPDQLGRRSSGGIAVSNNRVWGMTSYGGEFGMGTIFSSNLEGSDPRVEHSFSGDDGQFDFGGTLVSIGEEIWGVNSYGGPESVGTIFHIQNDGTAFEKVFDFSPDDGSFPIGQLLLLEDKLWGMAFRGGSGNLGTIFYINTDGSGFTKVFDFDQENGANPESTLSYIDGRLWGVTRRGGANNHGVIFTIESDGTGFTKVYDFEVSTGQSPRGVLVASNNKVWGTTRNGGANRFDGVIYSIELDGTDYTVHHDFSGLDEDNGGSPTGGLTVFGDELYGYTVRSVTDEGVIFKIDNDGTNFEVLFRLSYEYGGNPQTGSLLILKNDQSIDFPALAGLNEETTDFTLEASASSDLPVTFESDSEILSIVGSNASIQGIGEVTITASQEGDIYYNSALPVSQTLQIEEVLSLISGTKSILYPNPSQDFFSISGEKNGERVILVGIDGKIYASFDFKSHASYPVNKLPTGTYMVSILRNGAMELIGRLIKD